MPLSGWRDPAAAAVAIAVGVGLFGAGVIGLGMGAGGPQDPRAAFLLTPAFLAPILVWLVWTGRLRAVGVIWLLAAITAVHFAATLVMNADYKYLSDNSLWQMLDNHAQQVEHERQWRAARAISQHTALVGALKAGALGSLLSFLALLPLGRAFLRPSALAAMVLAAAALSGIAALGLTQKLPQDMRAWQFALWLFAPWQAVFGAALAWLFKDHRARRSASRAA